MATQSSTRIPWWRQLRTSLIVLVLVLVVSPLVASVGLVLPRTYSEDIEQIINQLDAVGDVKTEQILSWLEDGHHGLSFLLSDEIRHRQASSLLIRSSNALRIQYNDFLQAYQESTDTFDSLIVYSLEGTIVASSNPTDVGKLVNRHPYFDGSLNNSSYIQSPYYAVSSNTLAVFVSSQIVDENNELIGILGGTLRIQTLSDIMFTNSTGFPLSGETYLVSLQTNYFLTSSRFEGYDQNQAYNSEGIENALSGINGDGLYDDYRSPPVPIIGAYRWIPELDAALLVEVDQGEALAATFAAQTSIIIIAVISALLAIIVGYRFASFVANPIIELTQAAVAVASGDYSQRIMSQRQNEIGQLSSAFNTMSLELEHNIQNLETLNSELENRVADRTKDLRIAADVSRQVSRVLDMNQLLPYLVETTHNGFNLSHVNIYLYENKTSNLRLAAGSGSVGNKMMEEGKQFHLNEKGLVPLTARTFEHQIINDVQASKEHFVNPLLPDTRSETTLPMRVGTRLIGVLDLQSDEVNRFSDEQLAVLTSLADQIAIAVQNAELFAEAKAAREAAERSDQVKSSFLASMSHELRTPLNGIMNFTGVVADGMLGPVNEKQQKFLKDAVKNADHLLSLINDVLDISKIESGALKLFVEDDVNIAIICQDAARTGEVLLEGKPVELILNIADDLPWIIGDSRRIKQIVFNIVSNACKFTKEGTVTIGVEKQDQDILLWIKDSGPGIAPEDHEAVFETFLQTETGLRSGGGTGLGMPISRKLAEAHGGRLWIESELGKGATFLVTLPTQSEELKMQIIA